MRHDTRRQDKTRQDSTRQDQTRQDKTGQNKTRQEISRQDATIQNKTRQDKTRQGKTFKTSGALPCPVCPFCLLGFIMSYVACPHLFLESRHGDLRHFPVGSATTGIIGGGVGEEGSICQQKAPSLLRPKLDSKSHSKI